MTRSSAPSAPRRRCRSLPKQQCLAPLMSASLGAVLPQRSRRREQRHLASSTPALPSRKAAPPAVVRSQQRRGRGGAREQLCQSSWRQLPNPTRRSSGEWAVGSGEGLRNRRRKEDEKMKEGLCCLHLWPSSSRAPACQDWLLPLPPLDLDVSANFSIPSVAGIF